MAGLSVKAGRSHSSAEYRWPRSMAWPTPGSMPTRASGRVETYGALPVRMFCINTKLNASSVQPALTALPARPHPGNILLPLLALALGGFGIGLTEFAASGLLPQIAHD